jgi:hypothetical protein
VDLGVIAYDGADFLYSRFPLCYWSNAERITTMSGPQRDYTFHAHSVAGQRVKQPRTVKLIEIIPTRPSEVVLNFVLLSPQLAKKAFRGRVFLEA